MILTVSTLNYISTYTWHHRGGTFSMPEGIPVIKGYAVARPDLIGGYEIKRKQATSAVIVLVDEINRHNADTDIIGTWVNGGYCYAEPTTIHFDLEEAKSIARRCGQSEIFDLTTKTPIKVDTPAIMFSRVIVKSAAGYGYGQTVEEARTNHDRKNGLFRPITIESLPADGKWLQNEYGLITHPDKTRTVEEEATIDDILSLTLHRIECDVRADVDCMIRDREITNDEELSQHVEELPTYIARALDPLTLTLLFRFSEEYAWAMRNLTLYPSRAGSSMKSLVIQALTRVLGDEEQATREAFDQGAQSAVSALLAEWKIEPEVGADRVEAITEVLDREVW